MPERTKTTEFLAFCIESYAKAKDKSGAEVCALFERFGVLGYLERGYDVLHTMGEEWLLADIADFLKSRGYAA